jgi:hypothetical protein
MEQLEFDFIKEYEEKNNTKYVIFNEEEKIYPFNIFFNSVEEALTYLTLGGKTLGDTREIPSYSFKIHSFKNSF